MPYQTDNYTPPAIPPALIQPVKTFDDLRVKVSGIVNYLQLLNSSDITYFAHLVENTNQNATTEGVNIPVASTISIYKFMHVLVGNGAVTTIKPPLGFSGQLMLVSQDGFELVAGGNISMIQSPNVLPPGAHILLTWVPSRKIWYADSCRLQGTGGGPGGGGTGNGVLVTPALAGPGIHIDPTTYIISNTGVLSLLAGANISLTASTGNITISATGGGGGGGGPAPWTVTTSSSTPVGIGSGGNFYLRGSATAGADQVVNLPTATGSGWMALVKKMDSNPHNIVVTRAGTDTIDGLNTYTLTSQYSAVQLVDGASGLWDVMSVKP